MIRKEDIYWVAGILEGEGCFNYYNAPRIFLKMTDYDVVDRVSQIMKARTTIKKQDKNGWKTCYILAINSHVAVGWMMTLYSLMSARRKEQIRDVLSSWRNAESHNGFTRATGKALIRAIARKHAIPLHQAKMRVGKCVTGSDGRTYIG